MFAYIWLEINSFIYEVRSFYFRSVINAIDRSSCYRRNAQHEMSDNYR
jgi:hypothetical protein